MGALPVTSSRDRLKIVREARRLLGPSGENWIKGTMRGQRRRDGSPDLFTRLPGINPEGQPPVTKADCWCVLGSFDQACLNLNYKLPSPIEWREWAHGLGVSMITYNHLGIRVGWGAFNDNPETGWLQVESKLKAFEDLLAEKVKKERG